MLYYVSGPVAVLEPGLAVIDCGGVGYGCRVTAYTAAQLKLNQQAKLYITESIREDAFDLYGFISREEQRCYELLTSVTGVGPKAAISILASLPITASFNQNTSRMMPLKHPMREVRLGSL